MKYVGAVAKVAHKEGQHRSLVEQTKATFDPHLERGECSDVSEGKIKSGKVSPLPVIPAVLTYAPAERLPSREQ